MFKACASAWHPGIPVGSRQGSTQAAAETNLNGGTIISATPPNIQGGVVAGDGDIYASVVTRGRTVPGLLTSGVGALRIHGNYTEVGTEPMANSGGPYTLTEGGNVQLLGSGSGSGDILLIDIAGPEVGQFDSLSVWGSVTLAGGLDVRFVDGFTPSVGQQYAIVVNEGTGSINEHFAGLPEGAVFPAGTTKFQIGAAAPAMSRADRRRSGYTQPEASLDVPVGPG